ncbi:hypothetical protein JKP88DRAFT_241025 [Tribonema minus]|uniref:Uncharacterized protein n=1 Tax=Tribonema minus TaxID=303371 RepID=A0A836CK51_9STRA|nr:hypothetical protein JKP88DRAFT_241025 [Tribonema minus]
MATSKGLVCAPTPESLAKLKGARILFQWQQANMWSLGVVKHRLTKPAPEGLDGRLGYRIRFDAEKGVRDVWLSCDDACTLFNKRNKTGSWCIINKRPSGTVDMADYNAMKAELQQTKNELADTSSFLYETEQLVRVRNAQMYQLRQDLVKKDEGLKEKNQELAKMDQELAKKDEELTKKDEELAKKDEELDEYKNEGIIARLLGLSGRKRTRASIA